DVGVPAGIAAQEVAHRPADRVGGGAVGGRAGRLPYGGQRIVGPPDPDRFGHVRDSRVAPPRPSAATRASSRSWTCSFQIVTRRPCPAIRYASAMASISTRAPAGRPATCTVERAGGSAVKNEP